jgi:flavin-dependent dehydrogenase
MARPDADVLVVGGGPAGATVARVLAANGVHTLVLEAARGPRWKPGEVLAPNCVPVLHSLGLLDTLAASPALALPCLGIRRSWGTPQPRLHDYFAERGGRAFVVDRSAFEALLAARAVEAGARWQWSAAFVSASREGDGWRVAIAEGTQAYPRTLRTRFIVDASGRAARPSRKLGAARRRLARRVAICRTRLRAPDAADLWLDVRACANGWRYVARGPRGVRSEVLVTAPGAARPALTRRAHAICDASFSRLERCAGDGWVAVGDAATSFDPIASQGLPHAMSSGIAAALATLDWLARGSREALIAYASALDATWRHSVRGSNAVYAAQPRWRAAPFWTGACAPVQL